MRKKITSALFIILANLVLMVHAIIPHHHHDAINLCFNLFSSEIDLATEECDSVNDNHENDSEKDHCFLQNIVALSTGDIKQNNRGIATTNDLVKKISVFAVLSIKSGSLTGTNYFTENISSTHNPKYLSLACRVFGMRAPPVAS